MRESQLRNSKQVVILSGKGGTGKTTLTAALTALSQKCMVSDCDVDAADLDILLKPKIEQVGSYIGGKKAKINLSQCTKCGLCEKYCRFNAIHSFIVDQLNCEGCGLCVLLCADNAIEFKESISGKFYSGSFNSSPFFSAKLIPGEGTSGKLVSEVKKQAGKSLQKSKLDWYFVDGPPGIGCPVNASLTGADLVIAVTEPTISGIYDLERLLQLTERFQITTTIVINKYDINLSMTERIKSFSRLNHIRLLGKIPFDETVTMSLMQEKIITDYPDSPATQAISTIWQSIQQHFNHQKDFNGQE
jgi:MinD superfamily P-loop ATPase